MVFECKDQKLKRLIVGTVRPQLSTSDWGLFYELKILKYS